MANQRQFLCGAFMGRGNQSLFAASRSHDQDGQHTHMINLQNQQRDFHETWYLALGFRAYHSYANDDPGLTLTYLTIKSNLVASTF